MNCGLSVFVIFYSEEIDFLGRYQVSKNQRRREGSRSRKQQKTTYGSYYYYIIYIVYYYIYVRTDVRITQLTKRGYFTVASRKDMKKSPKIVLMLSNLLQWFFEFYKSNLSFWLKISLEVQYGGMYKYKPRGQMRGEGVAQMTTTLRGRGVKIAQNSVHVVCTWPL